MKSGRMQRHVDQILEYIKSLESKNSLLRWQSKRDKRLINDALETIRGIREECESYRKENSNLIREITALKAQIDD